MILLLDNYDSFTYNLVQYLGELGADVQVFRNDALTVEEAVKMKPDGIVLSPGPGRPERAGVMNALIAAAAEKKIPLLGVCLGHQGIGQVYGATIGYAPTLMHGKTSRVFHTTKGLYGGIPMPFVATRYHSLVIEPSSIPDDFEITAWTDDRVIMGISHRQLPIHGVQYHPESILTSHGKEILSNFLSTL